MLIIRSSISQSQGVTKRFRLSWLTNSALVYEPKCGGLVGEGGGGICGVSANENSCAHGTQKNSIFNLWPERNVQEQDVSSDGKLTLFRQPGCLVLRQLVDVFLTV
jgi:hypothetical protein